MIRAIAADARARAGAAAGAALLATACAAVGWVVASDDGVLLAAIGIAALVLAFVAAVNVGVAAGLLTVAILNGVPWIDLEALAEPGRLRPSDFLVLTLAVTLGLRALRDADDVVADPWWRSTMWWSVIFLGYWTWVAASSVLGDGIPPLHAALFGRDFLYFGLLLPLFVAALRREDEIFAFLGTIAVAATAHALGQIAIVLGGYVGGVPESYDWLIHTTLTGEIEGVTRIYAFMSDAVVALFALSAGLALMAPRRGLRMLGFTLAGVAGLSTLFQFTRATYAGLFIGFVVATAVWLARRPSAAAPIRRTALVAVAAVLTVATFVFGTGLSPRLSSDSPAAAVSTRAVSGFEEVTGRTGTLSYRYDVSQLMLERLDGEWLTGLGFWHPSARPVAGLPDNSIRNGDVGVLNGIMTMGIVGTILLYVPFAAALAAFFRRPSHVGRPGYDWFFYGMAAWLLAVLVGSLTLVQLYSVSGLILTAGVVACGVRMLTLVAPEPDQARTTAT